MTRAPPADVKAYLGKLPPAHRAALERLRAQILAAAPEAEERISYQIPGFFLEGKRLVWMAAFAKHCSFFPMARGVEIAREAGLAEKGFKLAKGTIQFAPETPIPAALVKRIVRANAAAIRAARKDAKVPPRRRPRAEDPRDSKPRRASRRRARG